MTCSLFTVTGDVELASDDYMLLADSVYYSGGSSVDDMNNNLRIRVDTMQQCYRICLVTNSDNCVMFRCVYGFVRHLPCSSILFILTRNDRNIISLQEENVHWNFNFAILASEKFAKCKQS